MSSTTQGGKEGFSNVDRTLLSTENSGRAGPVVGQSGPSNLESLSGATTSDRLSLERGPSARVYLDHNATTPLDESVVAKVSEWLRDWGNPSSIHQEGRGPKARLRDARANVAKLFSVTPLEIIFTSGGSESNNLAIKGALRAIRRRDSQRKHVLISSLEHPSLQKMIEALTEDGFEVETIAATRSGVVDLHDLEMKLRPDETAIVSVMLANNETGVVQPIDDVVRMAHHAGALVHTDAVQALGKIPVNLRALDVDYASFSAHKFYSLRGAGVLYAKRGAPLDPEIHGGGQERSRRGGTENVLAICSLGHMALRASEIEERGRTMGALRDRLEARILSQIDGVSINGVGEVRIPTTSSLLIPGVDGETLLMALDMEGFAVSTGAACSSGSPEPSPVLLAMGLTRAEAQCSLRIGIGWSTTEQQLLRFEKVLIKVVARLRELRNMQKSSISNDVRLEGENSRARLTL